MAAVNTWAAVADLIDPPPSAGARMSPLDFAVRTGRGTYQRARHLEILEAECLRAVDTSTSLLIEIAIRHGKSEFLVRFVAWWLLNNPDKRVIWASHSAEFARDMGRKVRDLVNEWGPQLFDGIRVSRRSEAANRWNIEGHAGGMVTVGAGGRPIGLGADLMVIDDPLGSYDAAMSPVQRGKVNDWMTGTMFSRLEPGAAVLMALARWHHDDPGGLVMRAPDLDWTSLRMPGLCDDPASDPLGRAKGEALWPERYSAEAHEKTRRRMTMTLGEFIWLAQVQQLATPREGGIFPEAKWGFIARAQVPVETRWVRGWDLAATEGGGDWTCGIRVGQMPDGRFVIGDVIRGQWSGHQWRTMMRAAAELDPVGTVVMLPQDPGSAGKDQAQQLVKLLAGYQAYANPVTGSKETRANSYAAQQQAGNIVVVEDPRWNGRFIAEHTSFPRGTNDDQVDAAATGFNKLVGGPGIPRLLGAL